MAGVERGRRHAAALACLACLAAVATAGCSPGEPAPAPVADLGAGERVAPYVDVTLDGTPDLAEIAAAGDVRLFNLAFVVAGEGCTPTWAGALPYDDPGIAGSIRRLRDAGGDVRVSFGGASPPELAARCPDDAALAAAYQAVVDAHDVRRVDFDVEGQALADRDAVRRRNRAIARLQATADRRGTPLRVSFTLPADAEGLTAEAQALLRDAGAAGVRVDAVNVMVMNYGTEPADLVAQATAVAEATAAVVRRLWPGTSEADAWRTIALTPMIGVNDVASEVLRPQDAARLVDVARSRGVGWLSFWSMNRDRPCPAQVTRADDSCSGVAQRPGEFTEIFARYGTAAGP